MCLIVLFVWILWFYPERTTQQAGEAFAVSGCVEIVYGVSGMSLGWPMDVLKYTH